MAVFASSPKVFLFNDDNSIWMLNDGIDSWLFPVLLIPLYQLLYCTDVFAAVVPVCYDALV